MEKTSLGPSQGERPCSNGSEYILFEILNWRHRIHHLGCLTNKAWIGPIWLSCLPREFYGLKSRISNEICSEPFVHSLSPFECPVVESFSILIKVLSAYCKWKFVRNRKGNMRLWNKFVNTFDNISNHYIY